MYDFIYLLILFDATVDPDIINQSPNAQGEGSHHIAEKAKYIQVDEQPHTPHQRWFSWDPQSSHISSKMSALRNRINKLLPLFKLSLYEKLMGTGSIFDSRLIQDEPLELLWYLYNLPHESASDPSVLNSLKGQPPLLKKCQEESCIKGFSPFSAVMFAPNITLEAKKRLIASLYQLAFQPTKEDREYAYLELCERDPNIQKIPLIFAGHLKNGREQNDEQFVSPFSLLPLEIVKLIIDYTSQEKLLLKKA